MAYNYIGLVNTVNKRLNEVELTEANFSTATGFYSFAKEAVNSAVRHINQEEFEWPFNHVEATETLLPGEVRYSMPYDAKTINMNSFRIKRDNALNVDTIKLKVLNYEEYLDKYADYEYNYSSEGNTVPRFVSRAPSRELIFVPSPDQAYEVVYEYYSSGYDMALATDLPTLPEQYNHVIINGAMYYVYQFRGDMQAAQLAMQTFEKGIKHLRSININRTEYIQDTRVHF